MLSRGKQTPSGSKANPSKQNELDRFAMLAKKIWYLRATQIAMKIVHFACSPSERSLVMKILVYMAPALHKSHQSKDGKVCESVNSGFLMTKQNTHTHVASPCIPGTIGCTNIFKTNEYRHVVILIILNLLRIILTCSKIIRRVIKNHLMNQSERKTRY